MHCCKREKGHSGRKTLKKNPEDKKTKLRPTPAVPMKTRMESVSNNSTRSCLVGSLSKYHNIFYDIR